MGCSPMGYLIIQLEETPWKKGNMCVCGGGGGGGGVSVRISPCRESKYSPYSTVHAR